MSKVAQARVCGKVDGKRGVGYKLLEEIDVVVEVEAEDAGELRLEGFASSGGEGRGGAAKVSWLVGRLEV